MKIVFAAAVGLAVLAGSSAASQALSGNYRRRFARNALAG
jgi:hypothetical protein